MKENYIIPFTNEEVKIIQGYNGPWSHKNIRKGTDYSYSLDFALPVGTEVIASRSGIVRFSFDEFNDFYEGNDFENGSKYLGNFIDILHEDGTIANYQHIESKSAIPKKGNKINQGEVIAKTGLSGWMGSTPHLHFMVYKMVSKKTPKGTIKVLQSIPVRFKNHNGSLEHSQLEKMFLP